MSQLSEELKQIARRSNPSIRRHLLRGVELTVDEAAAYIRAVHSLGNKLSVPENQVLNARIRQETT